MDFKWAMKQLTEGQKVRRDYWFEGQYYVMGKCGIELCNEETAQIYTTEILATDWVLFEEPKQTLSDNIQTIHSTDSNDKCVINCNEWCKVEDIKEFINKVKEKQSKIIKRMIVGGVVLQKSEDAVKGLELELEGAINECSGLMFKDQ